VDFITLYHFFKNRNPLKNQSAARVPRLNKTPKLQIYCDPRWVLILFEHWLRVDLAPEGWRTANKREKMINSKNLILTIDWGHLASGLIDILSKGIKFNSDCCIIHIPIPLPKSSYLNVRNHSGHLKDWIIEGLVSD
jgi:hypothetical protein